jgi:hypothetical protein
MEKQIVPLPGQFIAASGFDFVADGIKDSEILREKRINKFHHQGFYNHIGGSIDVNSKIVIGESLAEGFDLTNWEGSRYDKREVTYAILELYKPWSEIELFAFTKEILSLKGIPYDFAGIADQLDFCLTGHWKGTTGAEARKVLYCSKAIAMVINDLRKGIFPYWWWINPQLFVEKPCINVISIIEKL